MSITRVGHTSTLLPNGKVLITGGCPVFGASMLSTSEIYDPTTGKFTSTGSMESPRTGHTATLLANGKVLITGGGSSPFDSSGIRNTAELYDPSSGAFVYTGSMTTPRESGVAVLLQDGRVLVAGGHSGSTQTNTAEIYDPATGNFSITGSMATARQWFPGVLLQNGKVLVAGGYCGTASEPVIASTELYDPQTGRFSNASNMVSPRAQYYDAILLANGDVLFAGWVNNSTVNNTA
jgi:WD40 repeat protein